MGEPQTFDDVYRDEYVRVCRTVSLILGDRDLAEEVTQDAFAELHVRWRRIARYDRPGAWVRRVAIRAAVRRSRRSARSTALDALTVSASSAVDSPLDVDLLRAIDQLPVQQRAAVVLRYYADLPIDDVAAALGCAVATARVHLHRARSQLAAQLGEEIQEESDVAG